jgi:PilZ domain
VNLFTLAIPKPIEHWRSGISPATNPAHSHYVASMKVRRNSVFSLDGPADDRRVAISNRRGSPRIKTLKGAQIVWPNGTPVSCVVRNLSETGANLEAFEPVLQNTFDLVFDLDQSRRACRVIWRREPRIGVKFL